MSVASLSGYLNNGGGGSSFETITIGKSGTDVELSCVFDNKLNIAGITTMGVDIYNDAGDARVKLTCLNDNILDVNNIIAYTVDLANPDNENTVVLGCVDDETLSVPNIIVTGGITFSDGKTQSIAYLGGGGGGAVDSIIAGDGISVDTATGNVTVTNTGVLSLSAGNGISLDATTGAVEITSIVDIGVASLTAGPGIELTGNTGDITVSALAVTRVGAAKTVTTIVKDTATYSQHALNNVTILNFVGSDNKTAYTMTSNTIGQPAAFGCSVYFSSTDGTDTIVEPYYTFLGEPPAKDEQIIFAITAVNF